MILEGPDHDTDVLHGARSEHALDTFRELQREVSQLRRPQRSGSPDHEHTSDEADRLTVWHQFRTHDVEPMPGQSCGRETLGPPAATEESQEL